MSFIDGFISCAISDEGHSDIVRVNLAPREKMMYSIDSDNVEGLRVFQNSQEIEVGKNPTGGKTIVQFTVEPNNWFGMVYRRVDFVAQKNGVWEYIDNFHNPETTVFMLMLPKYAVVENVYVGPEKPQYKFDNHLILTQYISGDDLNVKMKYSFNSKKFATLEYPELKRSNFNAGSDSMESRVFGINTKGSNNFQKNVSILSTSIDWIGRAVTLYEALHYLKLLQ